MEPVNSTTFIKRPPMNTKTDAALVEANDILKKRLFLGYYDERRYVEELNDYRDVVIISPGETELIGDLENVRMALIKAGGIRWVGITGPGSKDGPSGYCLWVKFLNMPFGRFWFQIKQIKCEQGEVILKLKNVRSACMHDFDGTDKETSKASEMEESKVSSEQPSEYSFNFDPAQKLTALYMHLNEALRQVRPHLTLENLFLLCKFISALVLILFSAILTCIHYLGDYVLKLIRELTLLLHAVTPVLIQAIDCLSKIIGGFFILLAVFFKKHPNESRAPPKPALPPVRFETPMLPLGPPPPTEKTLVAINWRERNRILKRQLRSYPTASGNDSDH